jgi:hypothetical protein
MKFLKTFKINNKKAKDLSVTYRADGQIIMESTVSLALPIGTGDPNEPAGTAKNQRPFYPYNGSGLLRYNTDIPALEVLQEGEWFALKTKTPDAIVQQKFIPRPTDGTAVSGGIYVDGSQVFFGPLKGQNDQQPVGPKNVLVFVENVPQMAGDNYDTVESGNFTGTPGVIYDAGLYLRFSSPPPMGKIIYVLHGFD